MRTSQLSQMTRVLTLILWLFFSTVVSSQTISLAPKSGPPTTKTTVSGSGFTPNSTVRISFDSTQLVTAQTDGFGAFGEVSIQVPASALPGGHRVSGSVPNGTRAKTNFLVRTNWSQYRFSPDHTGFNPYENVLSPATVGDLQLRWAYATGSADYIYATPAVVNGVVYAPGWESWVYALNADTGTLLWQIGVGVVTSSPAFANSAVYVGSYGAYFYSLDAKTGRVLWMYAPTVGGDYYSPTVVKGTIYVGSYDNNIVYALDAKNAKLRWQYQAEGPCDSMAVVNGVVYTGSFDGNVYALDANKGTLLWKYATNGWVTSSPAVSDGVVFVGSQDGGMYALDASTGALRWMYATKGAIGSAPAVANGVVYANSQDGNLYAFDANTGNVLWQYFSADYANSAAPVVANGVVYSGKYVGGLFAVDASTGALLWQYTATGVVYSSQTIADGVMYATSWDGNIYAFGLATSKK